MPMIKSKIGRLTNPIFEKKAKGDATHKTKREVKKAVSELTDKDIRRIIIDLSYKAGTHGLVAECEADRSKIKILQQRINDIFKILKTKGLDLRQIQSKGITKGEIEEILGVEQFAAKLAGLYRVYYEKLDDGSVSTFTDRQMLKQFLENGAASLIEAMNSEYYVYTKNDHLVQGERITKKEIILAMGGLDKTIEHFGINALVQDFGVRYIVKACGGFQKFYNKYGIEGIKQLGLSTTEIKAIMSKIKK